jgi:Mg/Co/Ni transporter MgtE
MTPHSYESDILERVSVGQVMQEIGPMIDEDSTIQEVRNTLLKGDAFPAPYFLVANSAKRWSGIVSSDSLFEDVHDPASPVSMLTKTTGVSIGIDQSLRAATELMSKERMYLLAVLDKEEKSLSGVVSYKNIIDVLRTGEDHETNHPGISLRRYWSKMIIQVRRFLGWQRK